MQRKLLYGLLFLAGTVLNSGTAFAQHSCETDGLRTLTAEWECCCKVINGTSFVCLPTEPAKLVGGKCPKEMPVKLTGLKDVCPCTFSK